MTNNLNGDKQQSARKDILRVLSCCCIIAGITLIAFLPSLENGFTNWDDPYYVADNPDIQGFTLHHLAKVFSSTYVCHYVPVTMLTYMAEYRFFRLDPAAYHWTNLLLHIINCLLVFALIYGLSGSSITGLLVGLLFAVHPMRVESVAWIAERKDVLSSLFYFLSLLFYVRYMKKGGRKFYCFCALSLLLSLLSKPMAVSQPFVLLLIDYVSDRKPDRKSLLAKIPFLGIAAVFAVLAIITQKVSWPVLEYTSHSTLQRICVPFYGMVFYLVKTVVPVHLSAYYPFPSEIDSGMAFRLFAAPLLVFGIAASVYYFRRRSKKLVFGSLFFFITVLPVLQMVPVAGAITADRYTYVPLLGVYFIVAELYRFLFKGKIGNGIGAKTLLVSGAAIPLLVFACMTHERCGVWKDSFSLWNDVIAESPVAIAYSNRGVAYCHKGDYDRAIEDYTQAIRLNPAHAFAYGSRGFAYSCQGDYDRAIEDYTRSIRLNPRDARVYTNRGIAYRNKGDYDRAIEDYTQAARLNPASMEVYYNRGLAYKAKGDYDRAIEDYTRAVMLNPAFMEVYYNRGLAYKAKGDYDRAIEDFNRTIMLDPHYTQAYKNLGVAYCYKGDYDRAITSFDRTIMLNPRYAQAYNDRGLAYCYKGDYDRAIEDFNRTILLNPRYAQAYNNRGVAYKAKGDYRHAREDIKKACDLGFDSACKLLTGHF